MSIKRRTSGFVLCYVINKVDIKKPIASDKSKVNMRRDLTQNSYLLGNQTLVNLFAALIVRQNPKLQSKLPNKKYAILIFIKHRKDSPIIIQV